MDKDFYSPLTCYICGATSNKRYTYGMYGCLKDQFSAIDRFREKHSKEPESIIDICPKCKRDNSNAYINNIINKYGMHGV